MRRDKAATAGEISPPHSSFLCSRVRIDEISPKSAADLLAQSRFGTPKRVHLCNAYTLSLALHDRDYRNLLNGSDLNFADGHYVAMVGRWRGRKVMTQRVYGPALMLDVLDLGREKGLKHYLYGASPQTVTQLADSIAARFPGVEIVGVESPPFRQLTPAEESELDARVASVKPDVFWVGLGTPRQDVFVARYAKRLGCTIVPVGAAFDFHAGTKPVAPAVVQKVGMEWLFRLITEPVRLWRRYLFGIPAFIVGVATDRWFRAPQQPQAAPEGSPNPPKPIPEQRGSQRNNEAQ